MTSTSLAPMTKAARQARIVELLGEDNVFLKPFAVGELLGRVADVTGGPHGGGS